MDNKKENILISKEETTITVPNKGRAALIIFVATLILAVSLPDLTGAVMLGGALAMMLTGILTSEQAYSSIGWKSVFLVGGMLQLSANFANATSILGAVAVLIATINVAGGFLVTNRMLAMFRK